MITGAWLAAPLGSSLFIKVWANLSSPEIPPLSDILCWCCGQPWILLKGRNKSWSSTTMSQMHSLFPRQRNWIRPHHWPCTATGERNTLRQAGCQLFVWWTERFVWVCRTAEKWTQATAVQPGEHAFTLKRTPACLPNPAFCVFTHLCTQTPPYALAPSCALLRAPSLLMMMPGTGCSCKHLLLILTAANAPRSAAGQQ